MATLQGRASLHPLALPPPQLPTWPGSWVKGYLFRGWTGVRSGFQLPPSTPGVKRHLGQSAHMVPQIPGRLERKGVHSLPQGPTQQLCLKPGGSM